MASIEISTAPPPRRKRFQFSLRTLMGLVILFAALWVLTIKWGANQLAQQKTSELSEGYEETKARRIRDGVFELDGTIISTITTGILPKDEFSSLVSVKQEVIVTAPFPLILRSTQDWIIRGERYTSSKTPETYFWFYGARIQIGGFIPPQEYARPFNQLGEEDEEPVEK